MSFQPNPGDEVYISHTKYLVGQHPAAPGMAYAQAGRQGTVYKLIPEHGGEDEAKALKIFYPKYRNPALVYQSENMEVFSSLPGLKVCSRLVITPETNGTLIAKYPDMLYAVLMPWVNGSTWMDVLAHRDQLTLLESWEMAKGLASVGSAMEQKGLAHCDLSSPNVLLPAWRNPNHPPNGSSSIELVDVEQLYSPRLDPPDVNFTGSPGYASGQPVHRSTGGPWHAYADRFAGAIILAEMLSWSDPRILAEAWGESYFDPEEMQTQSARYELMVRSLEANWGKGAAELFVRAWQSDDVRNCPTFGEWLVVISMVAPEGPKKISSPDHVMSVPVIPPATTEDHQVLEIPAFLTAHELVEWARKQEAEGNKELALEGYKKALADSPPGGDLYTELSAAVQGLIAVQAPLNAEEPKALVSSQRKVPKRKLWLFAGAALLVLLIGTLLVYALPGNPKPGDESITHNIDPVKQPTAAAPPKTTTPVQSPVKAPAVKQDQQAEQAKAEAAAKAAKLEEERKKQEEAKRQEEAKKKAELEKQKEAQEKYDRQLQYEKYLVWKKERDEQLAKEAAEKQKADAARKAKLEQQKRENEQKARILAAKRDQQIIKLNASFNQAYNALKTGSNDTAKAYAWQFLDIYSQDSGYFSKNAKLAKRAASLKKFLAKNSAGLPDI